jgi:hypothetical protein
MRKFPKQHVFGREVLGELPVTNHFFARLGTETGVDCRDDCLYQLVISPFKIVSRRERIRSSLQRKLRVGDKVGGKLKQR